MKHAEVMMKGFGIGFASGTACVSAPGETPACYQGPPLWSGDRLVVVPQPPEGGGTMPTHVLVFEQELVEHKTESIWVRFYVPKLVEVQTFGSSE